MLYNSLREIGALFLLELRYASTSNSSSSTQTSGASSILGRTLANGSH
uniref:Uncharacterized protein n=1 Tax=Arundo donax TaxID=35708 RepID=A0A0A9BFK3_ARUDO